MVAIPSRYLVKGGSDPVFLRGTAKYAKLTKLDQWGKWSCSIYPDEESMPKVHKLISEGVKNKLNKDEDGYRITFSRPAVIMTKTKGDIELEPVVVEDAEGNVVTDPFVEDGADITMKLECYGGASPAGRGTYKAARLAGIKLHSKKADRPIPF